MKKSILFVLSGMMMLLAANTFADEVSSEVVIEKSGDKVCYVTTNSNGDTTNECIENSKAKDKAEKPVQIVREEKSDTEVCFTSTFADGSVISECTGN